MERRNFLKNAASFLLLSSMAKDAAAEMLISPKEYSSPFNLKRDKNKTYCRAITMWDFSWLERRWPGAGFEDWDQALNGLVERGYNAVRIDAYPHLIGANPYKKWELNEVWNQQDWGSPDINIVQVQPALNQFIAKCKERDIKVALSSWYRQDTSKTYMKINSPEKMADIWIATLKSIEKDNLLDNILYVDLCNEWPGNIWAPFFTTLHSEVNWGEWFKASSLDWMKRALSIIKGVYPDIPFLFSFDTSDVDKYSEVDSSFLDLYEHHIWMVQQNNGEFYNKVGYKYERFSSEGYKNVVKHAESLYKEKPEYWQNLLIQKINRIAKVAYNNRTPLATTECWGLVDYKDWPLLNWDWIKELCEIGTLTAVNSNMWVLIATSNFCAPQFVGMWRDIEWHQKLTKKIRETPVNDIFLKNPLAMKIVNRL